MCGSWRHTLWMKSVLWLITRACDVCSLLCLMLTGFEQSTESRHVMELGEKLATFDIETDTDVSVYPTDTGQHSVFTI